MCPDSYDGAQVWSSGWKMCNRSFNCSWLTVTEPDCLRHRREGKQEAHLCKTMISRCNAARVKEGSLTDQCTLCYWPIGRSTYTLIFWNLRQFFPILPCGFVRVSTNSDQMPSHQLWGCSGSCAGFDQRVFAVQPKVIFLSQPTRASSSTHCYALLHGLWETTNRTSYGSFFKNAFLQVTPLNRLYKVWH